MAQFFGPIDQKNENMNSQGEGTFHIQSLQNQHDDLSSPLLGLQNSTLSRSTCQYNGPGELATKIVLPTGQDDSYGNYI